MTPIISLSAGLGPGSDIICAGESYLYVGANITGAIELEWSQLSGPLNGFLNLSATDQATTTITPNLPGTYRLQLCATYEVGEENSQGQLSGPFIDCPYGAAVGEVVQINIIDCQDASFSTWTISGATVLSESTFSSTIQLPQAAGTASISVTCTRTDGSTEDLECDIKIYDSNGQNPLISSGEVVCVEVENCGLECFCEDITIIVQDCTANCEEDFFAESPKVVDKAAFVEVVRPEFMLEPFFGTKDAFDESKYELDDSCCDQVQRLTSPHRCNFAWNDVCNVWTIAGDAAKSCDCDSSDFWTFEGSGVWQGSGDVCAIDIAVIKDHNMISGQIISDPPIFSDGAPVYDIAVCQDKAKIGGFIRPIILNLDGLFEVPGATITFQNIVTCDGGPAQIGKVFLGQKFFLEGTGEFGDLLPREFQNPLDGTGCQFKVKTNNNCRRISRETEPSMVNWDITFCASEYWMQCWWKSYMRYLCDGNEGLFFPSRNNRPDEVICFDLQNDQDPPTFITCDLQEVTLQANSYVHYPALKKAV